MGMWRGLHFHRHVFLSPTHLAGLENTSKATNGIEPFVKVIQYRSRATRGAKDVYGTRFIIRDAIFFTAITNRELPAKAKLECLLIWIACGTTDNNIQDKMQSVQLKRKKTFFLFLILFSLLFLISLSPSAQLASHSSLCHVSAFHRN